MSTQTSSEKKEELSLKREVRAQVIGYVVAALGLVAGLAWNDAVKSIIEHFFPLSQSTIWAKIVYALILSTGVGVLSFNLVRWSKK